MLPRNMGDFLVTRKPGRSMRSGGRRPAAIVSLQFGIAFGAVGWSAQGGAQDLRPDLNANMILDRPRPGYDPPGIKLGGLRAFPSLTAQVGYDSNLYRRDDVVVQDVIYSATPRLLVQSDWTRHRLDIDAEVGVERFAKTGTEDNEQYRLSAAGRLDISRAVRVEGNGRYVNARETRGSAGDIFVGGEPIHYQSYGGDGTAIADFGRIGLRASVADDRYDYRDAHIGNLLVSQRYRDHDAVGAGAEAGLRIGPSLGLFVSGRYNRQSYDVDQAGVSLDSRGFTALAGVSFGLTQLLSGRIGLGYLRQTYADATFTTARGFTYDGSVTWNPTPLLALNATARKDIAQSPIAGLSGIFASSFALKADYELLRNLLIGARGSFDRESYRGLDRVDRRVQARLSARYLLNRNANIDLSYEHGRQRSRGDFARNYQADVVAFSVTVQI